MNDEGWNIRIAWKMKKDRGTKSHPRNSINVDRMEM